MSKILAIADIHLHDYPQKNPTPRYRLLQSRTIAQNIIDAGKSNGCDYIVLAGDIIEKFLIRPYIQAEVKLFLETVMKNFKEGFIIWGNHDQDNKGNNSEFNDSCLSVMLPSNLYYSDKKEINIDGKRIGFYNWRPEFDLSWINGKLDVLFTHATISYSDSDRFQSQYLDETKFDIAFCGDIHSAKQKGKFVSIGVPQRAKMGDSDKSTGIVYNAVNGSWAWVNLNPKDNLLKLEYTEDKEKEGWHPEIGTWLAYKPANQVVIGGSKDIDVPAWETIDKLILSMIDSTGLGNVHSEVLSNIKDLDSKEIDFSFQIKRLYVRNWRSIEEAELYFNQYDKIKIVGPNGSGKSSILSALKYAFVKNPDYKSLIQFGSPDCRVEVDFIYQGNEYRIIRGSGSKNYGLLVNGEAIKYNGKKVFEEDLLTRFPFIDFIQDVMFLDSDHPRFIGSISPERKSEIVSRFYKMDRLDAYNEEAQFLLRGYQDKGESINQDLQKSKDLLKFIDQKLSLLVLPTTAEDKLIEQRNYGRDLQTKWVSYNQFVTYSANLMAKKNMLEENLININNKISQFKSRPSLDEELGKTQGKIRWINEKYNSLSQVKSEGKRIYYSIQDLDKTKLCPSCGQVIKKEHMEEHKAELEKKMNELLEQQTAIYNEFWEYGIQDKKEIDSGCTGIIGNLNNTAASILSEIHDQENTNRDLRDIQKDIKSVESQLESLGPVPEKVELPQNFMEIMSKIDSDLSTWSQYKGFQEDKLNADQKVKDNQIQLDKLSVIVNSYLSYIKLTGTTGKIYEEIMKNLAQQFSDNKVVYSVETTIGAGNRHDHLNLMSSYVLGDNNVSYQNCSDGQKTFLDIDFMSKVLSRVGFLVFDEALKYLDSQKLEEVLEIIGQMDVNLILLSSHVESLSNFNNKSMTLSLDDNGVTQIQLI